MPGSSVTPDGSTQLSVGQYMQEILDRADRTFSDELDALTARHSGALTRDASACVANVGKAMYHGALSQLSQDVSNIDSVIGTEPLSTESSQAIEEFLVQLGKLVGFQRNVLSIIQTTLTTSKTVSSASATGHDGRQLPLTSILRLPDADKDFWGATDNL